jgi:hypothetical protein
MSALAGPILNGVLPTPTQPLNEALEYEKILRIRDEVFSGSHPRLTVPAHAIRLPSSASIQNPSAFAQNQLHVPSPSLPTASPSSFTAAAVSATRREDDATPRPPSKLNGVSARAATTTSQPGSNVSEFDPVLLTKSDDLVRAEMQLKRQRLEKALKEQFEHKRADSRKKPAPAEAKPDFDLAAIFARLDASAKSPSTKDDDEPPESVNEDDYYSSRAPDSTPEGPASESAEDADAEQADESLGPRAVSAVMGAPLNADADDRLPINAALVSSAHAIGDNGVMDVDDEEEEGEYSPPEATVQVPTPTMAHSQGMQDSRDPRGRPLRRYSEVEDNGGRPFMPSEANMRIVRSHIITPIAPRPFRVSPLAMTKDSPTIQDHRNGRKQWANRQSPTSPDDMQNMPQRKRRKLEKAARKARGRNGRGSPDIKDEDESPPPFHDVQPLGSARLRPSGPERPILIDDEPMQDIRYAPQPSERYVDSPSRPLPRQVAQLLPQGDSRPISRASVRTARDDQDLRRVASMHSMRGEPAREYAEPYYETPTRRAVSYARVGSPALTESGRQLRAIPQEYDQPVEIRVAPSPAPVYREIFDEQTGRLVRYIEEMPPPPVERIVVDSQGRRFREIIQERPSVAPQTIPARRMEMDPGYDHYPRQSRASSVFVDAPQERVYASEMPPPPMYRRVADPPRASAMPPPAREYIEQAPPLRSASVQAMDRPMRQPVYADEQPEFQAPMRAGSVRPAPVARYEERLPVEVVTRGQSVRPIAREGSVYVDDRRAAAPEYLPIEQPRYRQVAEPTRRYVDAQGREVIPMDEMMDGRPRVMERYLGT